MTKDEDWLFVLERQCPECDAEVGSVAAEDLADAIRDAVDAWSTFLSDANATDASRRARPETNANGWSVSMYGAHVADVCDEFQHRVFSMLTEEHPTFAFYDPSAGLEQHRWAGFEDVGRLVEGAGERFAAVFDSMHPNLWARTGERSDGAAFSVHSIGAYGLHELIHHLHDARQRIGR